MSGGVPAGELLPCPFCNGPAVNVAGEYISCGSPAFLTCAGRSVRADAEDWNTRATPTPPSRDADVERVDMQVVSDAISYAKRVLVQAFEGRHRKMDGVTASSVNLASHRLATALQALGERG